MNLFQQTLRRENNSGTPPIWFMRQAGRYHAHYQNLRKQYSFLDLCRDAKVSAEAAMGPIRDFDFDAAILFSDILFPLEALGVSLDFNPGPQLGRLLRSKEDLHAYQPVADVRGFFGFQAEALMELRRQLPSEKGLIGFVGGPLTLYQFACEGSGKAERIALDERFPGFMEKLIPLLAENMAVQADAEIDCLAILDSSAGIISEAEYSASYLPFVKDLIAQFRSRHPQMPVLYYAKGASPRLWTLLESLNIQGIGVDHYQNLTRALTEHHGRYAIQGNFPPEWMNLPWKEAEPMLQAAFAEVASLPPAMRQGWICGLGHGMQPLGREENVRNFVRLARETFRHS